LDDPTLSSLGQYDWRELIYRMALDNFAARDRISGLEAALATISAKAQAELEYQLNPTAANATAVDSWREQVMYHYDYKRLSRVHYNQYWRYNTTNKKFTTLKSAAEFDACKAANEFLYGSDMTKRKVELSSAQLNELITTLGYDPYKYDVADYNLVDDPQYGASYKNYIYEYLP